jgi:hypothetical protein
VKQIEQLEARLLLRGKCFNYRWQEFEGGGGGFSFGGGGGFVDVGDPVTGGMSGEAVFRSLGVMPSYSSDYPRYALAVRNAQRGSDRALRDALSRVDGANTVAPANRKSRAPSTSSVTSKLTSSFAGVPVWAWIVLAALLFLPGGRRRRH